MRIGLVLPSVPAYSETFFSNKIKGLQANGHTVLIFTNSNENQHSHKSIIKVAPKLSGNPILIGCRSIIILIHAVLFHYKATSRLYTLDHKDGIRFNQRIKNIVSNHHIFSESLDWLHFGYGTMVVNRENVAKAIGAKMAVSFRGFDIGIYPLNNPGCYSRLWKKVDKIHVISNDIRDLVYTNGFKDQAPIIKITPAIDTAFFKNTKQQVPTKQLNFVTVARLHWKKGLIYTLEALALFKKEGISFHYTIIGGGEAYERLKFAVYQLDLKDQVTFTGKISQESIIEKMKNGTIYLQYSIQEGFCNAVLEAQSMGLLCIVSDAEGLAENVIHNKTGWVVPKRNSKKLTEQLLKIVNLPEEEKHLIRKEAMIRVKTAFNLKKQQQEFFEFYN